MTDEQFERLFKMLENIDWKLWEIHKMVKGVLNPDDDESETNDEN